MITIDYQQKILDAAEHLTQLRGFNAFSYRDIASIVGIKTSSIHYYFPTKADLGHAILKNYMEYISADLNELMEKKGMTYRKKLAMFFDMIFSKTYHNEEKMCLAGMLASDANTLDETIVLLAKKFFSNLSEWLETLISKGIEAKEFNINKKTVKSEVLLITTSLEGALLIARVFKSEKALETLKNHIIERLVMR